MLKPTLLRREFGEMTDGDVYFQKKYKAKIDGSEMQVILQDSSDIYTHKQ